MHLHTSYIKQRQQENKQKRDFYQPLKCKAFSLQINHQQRCQLLLSFSNTARQPDGNFQASLVLTPNLLPEPGQNSATCHAAHQWGKQITPLFLNYLSSQTTEGRLNSIMRALPSAFPQPTVKLGVITQVESSAVVFLINTVFLSISFSFSLSEHQSQFYRGHHSWENKNPEWFLIGCFFWPAHQIKTIVFGRYQQLQDLTNPRSFHEKGLSFSLPCTGHKKPSTPDQPENLENISVRVQKRHFADYIIMAA